MRLLAQRHSLLLQATALAPLIALVAPIDRAEAACDPASPVNFGPQGLAIVTIPEPCSVLLAALGGCAWLATLRRRG